jgi:hypothetical protein
MIIFKVDDSSSSDYEADDDDFEDDSYVSSDDDNENDNIQKEDPYYAKFISSEIDESFTFAKLCEQRKKLESKLENK